MALPGDQFNHIEICGDAIFPVIRAISADALCTALLRKHGLENPQKGTFYPVNRYLGLLNDIDSKMPTVLKGIGAYICVEVEFPPNMNFEQILMVTDQAYLNGHRGYHGDEIGHYRTEKKTDKEFIMTVDDPYPCNMDQGIISGYAKKFGVSITLDHLDGRCRSNGDPQCVYRIVIDD